MQDEEGNRWFKRDKRAHRINHGVRGAHASISFQCESCWIMNLEGRLPVPGTDDAFIMLIRRANLDAMGGRAQSTIEAHAAAIKRWAQNCKLFGMTPPIPPRGPMPMAYQVGMAVAVSLLFNSLTAKPRLAGESHIQFDSMRRPRATHTSAWESSPKGISEGSSITTGMTKATLTTCPTQQKWFNLMMRGAENRMGYATRRQQPLSIATIIRLLELVKEEAEEQEHHVAREFFKVGAAIALAVCGSLRGNEVFMLDLNGLRKHISLGKEGTLPKDPMKVGTDLSQAPHIIIPLLGEFKGELGFQFHLMSLASTTSSGIELRWWMEKLIQVRQEENCTTGPGFGHKDGSVALMREYDEVLQSFLSVIQQEDNDLIAATDDVQALYGLSRTFRRTVEGRARAANLESDVQNAMNRWRKVEQAKGKCPRFNMVDHYAHARDLMHVTWRYSFVQ